MTSHPLNLGDTVQFDCHIYGRLTGTVKHLTRCVTNAQPHAVVRATLSNSEQVDCHEPVINLERAA